MSEDALSAAIWQGLLEGLTTMVRHWSFWLLVLLMVLLRWGPELYHWLRPGRSRRSLDQMDSREFRQNVADRFTRLGYRVEQSPYRGDYGTGLILSRRGERWLALIKHWHTPVSMRAVEEAAALRTRHRCHHALVVSNQPFTSAARKLAAAKDIELWDGRRLSEQPHSPA